MYSGCTQVSDSRNFNLERRRQAKLRIIVFPSNVRHFVLIERVFVLIVKTSLRIGSPFRYSKIFALEF